MDEIIRLQTDAEFRMDEGDRFCLVALDYREIDETMVANQAKFCVLQTINGYKDGSLTKEQANYIINKVDAIIYSIDMLGAKRVIDKLNQEVIGEELYTPHFNYLCIECDELYANLK